MRTIARRLPVLAVVAGAMLTAAAIVPGALAASIGPPTGPAEQYASDCQGPKKPDRQHPVHTCSSPTVAPSATAMPPTATAMPPTATAVPPTATAVPPTATAVPPTATAVPPTATAVPPASTATPAPLATATAMPAPTVAATPAVIGGVSVCATHDPTRWHGLVERNADGSIACTYTHEHKDDPRVLDSIFGPLAYGEISYPWMTHGSLGSENDAKHRVYAWHVVEVPGCRPSNAPYGFDAIRLQAHQDGNGGAAVRFHSFSLQARACDPGDGGYHGTITIGGHVDYGRLFIDCQGGSFTQVPLPGDPIGGDPSLRRLHGGPDCARYDATWYGALTGNGGQVVPVTLGLRSEDWGPIDPNDPTRVLFYGGGQNGSWQEPAHLVAVAVSAGLDSLDGALDGVVNYSGWTNRYGSIVTGCTVAGIDCVPLELNNMKVGLYQFRADGNGIAVREYGVAGPTGQSLIQYPN